MTSHSADAHTLLASRAVGRRLPRTLLGTLMAVLLIASLFGASPANAGPGCLAADLDPVLADAMVNQGLPYTTLVRGKDALARFYLMEPACASDVQTIQVTGATLTSTTSTGASLGPQLTPIDSLQTTDPKKWPEVAPFTSNAEIAKDIASNTSPGNPRFAVPETYMKPAVAPGAFTATFRMRVNYTFDTNGPAATGGTGTDFREFVVSRPVQGPTASLRILAVAMGDPSAGFLGEANLTAGFGTLSRTFPVPDGSANVGQNEAGRGGILYRRTPGTMDIKHLMLLGGGKFCGTSETSGLVRSMLADRLAQHNSANDASKAVDRAVGAIDTASSSGSGSCAEGMAGMGTKESWVRTPNGYTGGLLTMESAHNSGATTALRNNPNDRGHSPNGDADGGTDRAYNLSTNDFLQFDQSALQFGDPSSWNDGTVLLEQFDWDQVFCRFGGPITADCASASPEGAVLGSSAGGQSTNSVLIGLTDGTAENSSDTSTEWLPGVTGTQVFDSFVGPGITTPAPATGEHRFVLRSSSGAILSDLPVQMHEVDSIHDHGPDHHDGPVFFSISYAYNSNATRWELWKGTPGATTSILLAARDKIAAPTVTAPTMIPAPGEKRGIGFDDQEVLQPPAVEGLSFNADARVVLDPRSSSAPNSVINLQAPIADGPLTIDFDGPIFNVGMQAGNGLVGTSATLEAFAANGDLLDLDVAEEVTPAMVTDLLVSSEKGNIARIELTYRQDGGGPAPAEEIDDLTFTPGNDGGLVDVDATSTTTGEARHLRGAFFVTCSIFDSDGNVTGTHNIPVATALKPYKIEGDTGHFRFRWDSASSCEDGGAATIRFRSSDGYSLSPFSDPITQNASDSPPDAAILSPVINGAILEHQALSLAGEAYDSTDGVLPGNRLQWFASGPGFTGEQSLGTGNELVIPPPSGFSWELGTYTIRLVATDFEGNSASTTSTVLVEADFDNDGIPARIEQCYAGAGDPTPDQNPFNAYLDADEDGKFNSGDPNACVPASDYNFLADFDANSLNPGSGGNTMTVHLTSGQRSMNDVAGSSVRINQINGRPVSPNDPTFNGAALTYQVVNGVGVAKFDRQKILQWHAANGIPKGPTEFLFGGSGASVAKGVPFTWTFDARDTINLK